MMTNERATFLEALASDLGKVETESMITELLLITDEIKEAQAHLKTWMKAEYVPTHGVLWPATSEVRQDPLGSTLVIGPFNYPRVIILLA
jgi:aldehyde dehydrogenase (NAD+)